MFHLVLYVEAPIAGRRPGNPIDQEKEETKLYRRFNIPWQLRANHRAEWSALSLSVDGDPVLLPEFDGTTCHGIKVQAATDTRDTYLLCEFTVRILGEV